MAGQYCVDMYETHLGKRRKRSAQTDWLEVLVVDQFLTACHQQHTQHELQKTKIKILKLADLLSLPMESISL